MRIVFFGTPEFAVPSLRALVGEGFDITTVITQPDRPQGRSRSRTVPSPVHVAAREADIPVHQPETPNTAETVALLERHAPDIGVVVAYGHILKQALLDVPPKGMLNVHASLLPALRGAAPIEHAILAGLDTTGITVMRMVARMDAGPTVLQVPTPVARDETGGELTVRLAELGALALVEALALIDADAAVWHEQDHEHATFAPKISRELASIRWEEPASRIARQARAFDPRPGAWTTLRGHDVKLFGPIPGIEPCQGAPGEIVETDPALIVATGDGAVQFLDVQPAGRPRMAAADWIRGRGAAKGDRFV